jgi:hypothetical protein
MTLAREMTRCPLCREPILAGASRCRHCHADLGAASSKKNPYFSKIDDFRHGFLTGILFTLLLVVLAWFQFFASK